MEPITKYSLLVRLIFNSIRVQFWNRIAIDLESIQNQLRIDPGSSRGPFEIDSDEVEVDPRLLVSIQS